MKVETTVLQLSDNVFFFIVAGLGSTAFLPANDYATATCAMDCWSCQYFLAIAENLGTSQVCRILKGRLFQIEAQLYFKEFLKCSNLCIGILSVSIFLVL